MKRNLATAGAASAAILTAGLTLAISGCSDDDEKSAKSSTSSTTATTTAPAGYTWGTFKSDYNQFLTTTCEDKTGDAFTSCLKWQVIQINSLTQAVKQLPAVRTRFDAESSIATFQGTYEKMTAQNCLLTGNMDDPLCGIYRVSAIANVRTIQTYLNMGA
ncbi:hypothetical protein [Nocardia sp. NPDC004722]